MMPFSPSSNGNTKPVLPSSNSNTKPLSLNRSSSTINRLPSISSSFNGWTLWSSPSESERLSFYLCHNSSFSSLPRQLQNSTASLEEPLLYPPNINANLLPRTKRELLGLDLAAAQAAAHTLGLPPLVNPTAAQCRQYVYDFVVLGAR